MKLAACVIALLVVVDTRTVDACGSAPPAGEEVRIADEEAIIVWDPKTKTEQFIRRARFDSTARSFGFLVPTPTMPKLDEVREGVFSELARAIRPQVVTEPGPIELEPGALLFEACTLSMSKSKGGMIDTAGAGAPAGVQVIQSVNVAGFDATTIAAETPEAISAWLGKNGFAETPQLTEWLAKYVTDKWVITAFVIAKKDDSQAVTTSVVRMTFTTEKPFYPYREPAPIQITTTPRVQSAGRLLRVFFFGPERVDATLGATLGATQPWTARVLHAGMQANVAEIAQPYMTVFVDESSPRNAIDELYFAPAKDTTDIRQTIVNYEPRRILIPLDVLLLVGAFVWWRVARREKKR